MTELRLREGVGAVQGHTVGWLVVRFTGAGPPACKQVLGEDWEGQMEPRPFHALSVIPVCLITESLPL